MCRVELFVGEAQECLLIERLLLVLGVLAIVDSSEWRC